MHDLTFYLYSGFLILIAIVSFITRKDSCFFQSVIIVSFVLVCGFRDLSVPDTLAYYEMFYKYGSSPEGREVGFTLLTELVENVFGDHVVFFSLIPIINLFLIRMTLVNLRFNVTLGLIAYISFYGFLFNFILLRVGVAISLFVCGCSYLITNLNKWKGYTFISLSPLFHYSIITQILALPILMLRITKLRALSIVLISLFVYISGVSDGFVLWFLNSLSEISIFSRYQFYIVNLETDNGYSYRFILNTIILFISVLYINSFDKIGDLCKICLFGVFATAFFSVFLWVDRITDAFVVFIFLIVTYFAYEKDCLGRYNVLNLIVYFVFLISNFIFVSRIMKYFLYQNIF